MQNQLNWTSKFLPAGPLKKEDRDVYTRVDYWMSTPQGDIPCIHYPYYHWLPYHGPWMKVGPRKTWSQ
jgi:hypothetical protein